MRNPYYEKIRLMAMQDSRRIDLYLAGDNAAPSHMSGDNAVFILGESRLSAEKGRHS